MGKFVRKFNDYNKRGCWGKRTVKYGVIKREVVIRRFKDPELNLTRTFSDITTLNMTVKENQSTIIYMAMQLGSDYDKLERDYNEVKAKNNVLSTNFSVLKKENDSLQNEVESLKSRIIEKKIAFGKWSSFK